MGLRDDATLSPQERAALAGLEARAAADDPALAASLRGTDRFKLTVPSWLPPLVGQLWVGPVLLVAGILLTLLSLSVSLVLGIFGALVMAAGIASLGHAASRRLAARGAAPDDDDDG